jgi:dihydrolipoamide dehydrogenase
MVIGDLATSVDVLVLGAGPGGYVAAIRAAQLGKQVALVDPGPIGGTCLNLGCIPSKALLSAADQFARLTTLDAMGITLGQPQLDFGKMQEWKNSLVRRLSRGVQQLLQGNGVQLVKGKGWFIGEDEVRVEGEYGSQRFSFERCIIAVGAEPAPLPGFLFDGSRVLTPGQALSLQELPAELALIGCDYIAAELATLFAKLNVAVTWSLPEGQRLLPEFDPLAGRQVQAKLKKLGVKIDSGAAEAAVLVIANGLQPRTETLNLAQVQVQHDERGFIPVNAQLQTSNPNIYALGDVTGGPPLATVAIKQAKVAAEHLAGKAVEYAPQALPRVAWTDPPIASVGLTAAEAEAAGYEVMTGRFPLAANGRALTLDAADGLALIVAERASGVLLGVTLVGAGAEVAIGEAALALEMGATLTDLAETLHPHPGLSEPLQEAAEAALGLPVHVLL